MSPFRLAWLQLVKEKLRLLVAVSGVGFAVILIFMQLGFQEALFKSSTLFHEILDGEVFLISPEQDFLAAPKYFSRRRVLQALSFDGVESASSVYVALSLWKNPMDGTTRAIFVVGVDPSRDVITLSQIRSQLDLVHTPDAVLYDRTSRAEFGPIAEKFAQNGIVSAEVANRRVNVVGLFEMGTSFGIDGTIFSSDINFLRIVRHRDPGLVNIGVIKLAPDADAVRVRSAMREKFPKDVLVLTKEEFVAREHHYWKTSTPIGYVFQFGVIMGLVVGAIIVYQILFADVSDHLAEYATLKAMGYPNSFLVSVVLSEALVLAILGFLPGAVICLGLYHVAGEATRLPLQMTVPVGLFVFGLAVAMCSVSGLIAVRKVRSADPAEIF